MNEILKKKLQRFSRLSDEHSQVFFQWIRQVLTLASGSLAILVAFQSDTPIPCPEKYFLLTTWIALGLGILAGAFVAFLQVAIKGSLRRQCLEEIQKMEEGISTGTKFVSVGEASWVYTVSFYLMNVSFVIAVVSLVIYASFQTL
ncbi:hypothetical protein [Puniceicoccus vermicola]|uniref:DUF202 domain-containing protein n=1 Tax=Puniceicoccus vermicola TaxID=388746 RepID=A0A7X1E632_9BACT|nr:hypothetical protein [Puniceicoccus vermicola]MBC2603693.1 hypothetical protein [Puniceicoccus vermicola]